jgi:putative RNA 2'-phosphotransferase
MKEEEITQLSKFLSFVLRHRPETIGITLDPEGWASVDSIIAGAAKSGRMVVRDMIERVVATNDKKRFAFSLDGHCIRAVQGHSTNEVTISFEEHVPPALLYHGTATRFLPSIREQGLVAGNRHHVHLSADAQMAVSVGVRHGKPVVLAVNAAAMHAQGTSSISPKMEFG